MQTNALKTIAFAILATLFFSCEKKAILNVNAEGLGPNAVISVYSANDSKKALLIKDLKSNHERFELKFKDEGYGKIEESDKNGTVNHWFYLDNSEHEIDFSGKSGRYYPVTKTTSKKVQEIIDYYQLRSDMGDNLSDSIRAAEKAFFDANSENVIAAAANLNDWKEQATTNQYEVIKKFAANNPSSFFTILMIKENLIGGKNARDFRLLIEGLDKEVKETKEAKTLIADLEILEHTIIGAKMATVEGTDPNGKAYNPRVLKKVNLFICWTSYDKNSRQNHQRLVELYNEYKHKDVEFIGISYDQHKKWWTAVIKDDGLTWPQFSDLKGLKSPNTARIANNIVPSMFITDQKGIILFNNVQMGEIKLDLDSKL
ncbi:MAG: TlpA family protein disulfide reductase [Pedobacter sp.]|nr:MAG: TlpA family protein disulfide reductase [Pedobacter sp.]